MRTFIRMPSRDQLVHARAGGPFRAAPISRETVSEIRSTSAARRHLTTHHPQPSAASAPGLQSAVAAARSAGRRDELAQIVARVRAGHLYEPELEMQDVGPGPCRASPRLGEGLA